MRSEQRIRGVGRGAELARAAIGGGLAALVVGCVMTGQLVVEPGRNVLAAKCPVPVRASVRRVEDRRGTTDARNLGSQRFRYSALTVIASRPPTEGLRAALEGTLAECAPAEGAPGRKLVLDVELATFQVDQTQYGYQVLNTASIGFSVRVFDETGERFLDSFDVKKDSRTQVEAGGVPEVQFLVDQILHDSAGQFTWDFVPAIRKHGS